MRKETIKKEELKLKKILLKKKNKVLIYYKKKKFPRRIQVLNELQKNINNKIAIIATTGKTGRELFSLNDC